MGHGSYGYRPTSDERTTMTFGPLFAGLVLGLFVALVLLLAFMFVRQTAWRNDSGSATVSNEPVEYDYVVTHPYDTQDAQAQAGPGPFVSHQRIAHAGGAWRGGGAPLAYTNSLEALEQNYDFGFRFFEVDLQSTSDGDLALVHDWTAFGIGGSPYTADRWRLFRIPTEAENTYLTTMLASDLVDFLQRHPDATVVCDTKDYATSAEEANTHLRLLRTLAQERDPEILERLVPYTYSVWYSQSVPELAEFPHVAFATYATQDSAGAIMEFSLNNPQICMVCADLYDERFSIEAVDRLEKGGVPFYVFPSIRRKRSCWRTSVG